MIPKKRRFGFVTNTFLYLLIMGGVFCAVLYPLAAQQYDKQVRVYAASLPDYSNVIPPVPFAIGHPTKVEVPSVGVSLPVVDGVYDKNTRNWTLTSDKVQYATTTALPNSRKDNTFIYGHATNWVFGPLLRVQPGAEATVTTDTFVFTYRLTSHEVVDPKNTALFEYKGKPRLTLQTCTGPTLSEYRQLFYFDYVSHKRV
ncbi:sortase [Candidatus Saccharibacteria bacterium]|nr:MAG: sortase [Candidatus Saccharibacteria bacterium]